MNGDPHSSPEPSRVLRVANVLVVVALLAMLVGGVTLLLARDHSAVDLGPGQEAVLLDRKTPSWALGGETFEVQATTNAGTNVTVSLEETTGTGFSEENRTSLQPGQRLVWSQHTSAGEQWNAVVINEGEAVVRAAITVTSHLHQWVGGLLVAFGVAGFVFHRMGMRKG
jgi:hypothetical protein